MLSNWWSTPDQGARSSTDDGNNRADVDDDGQPMEADQGNGKYTESHAILFVLSCARVRR